MAKAPPRRPIIYLAGGFYNQYRTRLIELLGDGFDYFDPEADSADPNIRLPGCYVGKDLWQITESDLVVAIQDDYPYVYGMAAECGFAVPHGKPIIYICLGKRVDSFLSGLARACFTELEAAAAFIVERYGG